MKTCGNWPIAVCNWSLQTGIDGVAEAMKQLELNHVHLDVGPALEDGGDEFLAAVKSQGWTISSTMIGYPQEDYTSLETIKLTGGILPDDAWEGNKALALGAVKATAELGVQFLSTHAGFLDHSNPELARRFTERITLIADAAEEAGITFLLETGQETAADLKSFLQELDHPAVGVNFDPANMLLYGKGTPADAVRELAPWIKHVHIKDAVAAATPGEWGAEVPWGDGEVGGKAFLDVLADIGYDGCIAIEREGGDQRLADISQTVELLTA